MNPYEIRADFDRDTIVVYQAFGPQIAKPAVKAKRFQPPFSMHRMTWLKPSFLWLMARSNWGQKSGQEHILAVRIARKHWEEALAQAVLTSPEKHVYADRDTWRTQFAQALVHVQWDPEYSLRGAKRNHRAIQVGISRHLIRAYVEQWTLQIEDLTPLVRKIHTKLRSGDASGARRLLPPERPYPTPTHIAQRLGM